LTRFENPREVKVTGSTPTVLLRSNDNEAANDDTIMIQLLSPNPMLRAEDSIGHAVESILTILNITSRKNILLLFLVICKFQSRQRSRTCVPLHTGESR